MRLHEVLSRRDASLWDKIKCPWRYLARVSRATDFHMTRNVPISNLKWISLGNSSNVAHKSRKDDQARSSSSSKRLISSRFEQISAYLIRSETKLSRVAGKTWYILGATGNSELVSDDSNTHVLSRVHLTFTESQA